jgi:predicted GTPase
MCDVVVTGTPIDLTRVLAVSVPVVRARYDLRERTPGQLEAAVREVLERHDESGGHPHEHDLAAT